MAAVVLAAVALIAVVAGGRTSVATAEGLSISGTAWWDEDGDGVRDTDERLSRLTVALFGPDGSRTTVRANDRGEYVFGGLAPGDYTLSTDTRQDGYTSFVMTYPRRDLVPPFMQGVTLTSQSLTGVDFGFTVPRDSATFSGQAWVNAAPAGDVRALIDGVDCTAPAPIIPPDSAPNSYYIGVFSSQWLDGCGDPGDTVTFTVGGLPANETAPWHPSNTGFRNDFELTVGPPFAAVYVAPFAAVSGAEPRNLFAPVVALIDGKVCGSGQAYRAPITIPSRELVDGCGYPGALISFAVAGLLAQETLVWSGELREELRPTVVPAPGSPMAGPAFACFLLDLPAGAGATGSIGGTHCGSAASSGEPGPAVVAVAPDQLDPGCGHEGAPVRIDVYEHGAVVAQVDALWFAGQFQHIEWATSPSTAAAGASSSVTPPSVGDAGLR
jgi:hypothetical protein